MADQVGIGYIALLLRSPLREVPAVDLIAATRPGDADTVSAVEAIAEGLHTEGYKGEPDIDAVAVEEYRKRIDALNAQKSSGGLSRSEAEELDVLQQELRSGLGLGGRRRHKGGDANRARRLA